MATHGLEVETFFNNKYEPYKETVDLVDLVDVLSIVGSERARSTSILWLSITPAHAGLLVQLYRVRDRLDVYQIEKRRSFARPAK
jgi:hypothetical protein